MTRQGRSPGYKPRVAGSARTDSHALPSVPDPTAQMRADAARYLERTGNADLLMVLGLVDDPVAAERRRNKALVDMGAKPYSKRGRET